jgi:endonuclease-3 related protein
MLAAFGKRHWWPGDTSLEVMVGAILTQNTAWKNVEKALHNMKSRDLLDVKALSTVSEEYLADTIRSSGFYNIKAHRLKGLMKIICDTFHGSTDNPNSLDTEKLRKLLLGVDGIGPETADSILLYAFNRPVFVVDAYTRRFLRQHRLTEDSGTYDEIQQYFVTNLPSDTYLFNEFHALIVCLCQSFCRKVPICRSCPLEEDLIAYRV